MRLMAEGPEGITLTAAARELGISLPYASSCLNHPDRKREDESPKKTKKCPGCGSLIQKYSKTCRDCAPKTGGSAPVFTKELIVEAIQEWHLIYGRVPFSTEWQTPRQTGLPDWVPSTRIIYHKFGSWNNAIQAAGFDPRPPIPPEYARFGSPPPRRMSSEERERRSAIAKKLYAEGKLTGLEVGWENVRRRARLAEARRSGKRAS